MEEKRNPPKSKEVEGKLWTVSEYFSLFGSIWSCYFRFRAVDILGGRLSDLEALIVRYKNGKSISGKEDEQEEGSWGTEMKKKKQKKKKLIERRTEKMREQEERRRSGNRNWKKEERRWERGNEAEEGKQFPLCELFSLYPVLSLFTSYWYRLSVSSLKMAWTRWWMMRERIFWPRATAESLQWQPQAKSGQSRSSGERTWAMITSFIWLRYDD